MAKFRYTFPVITGDGYFWHLANKAQIISGQFPITRYRTGTSTVLVFATELSTQDEADIRALFDDPNTTLDPVHPVITGGDKFRIKDIWETRADFQTAIGGMPFSIWFTKSSGGILKPDQIDLHFQQLLTNPQKNAIKNTYADMIAEM